MSEAQIKPCRNGHDRSDPKSYVIKNGYRLCLKCKFAGDEAVLRRRYRARARHKPTITGMCQSGKHEWVPENWYISRDDYARCKPCRRAREREKRPDMIKLACVVGRGCRGNTYRKIDDGSTYICPKHRKNPPAWIQSIGAVIIGSRVIARAA